MLSDLVGATEKAFADGDAVAEAMAAHRRGFRHEDGQVTYAGRVARTLASASDGEGVVTLLEAETGTGKSLGYLVPLCLEVVEAHKRGVISTYTRLLQSQILIEDFPIAAHVARLITGRVVRAAPRLGLRNFISASRVEALREALSA